MSTHSYKLHQGAWTYHLARWMSSCYPDKGRRTKKAHQRKDVAWISVQTSASIKPSATEVRNWDGNSSPCSWWLHCCGQIHLAVQACDLGAVTNSTSWDSLQHQQDEMPEYSFPVGLHHCNRDVGLTHWQFKLIKALFSLSTQELFLCLSVCLSVTIPRLFLWFSERCTSAAVETTCSTLQWLYHSPSLWLGNTNCKAGRWQPLYSFALRITLSS